MSRDVTVVTASLPDRATLREEAIQSVAAQTSTVADHLVGIDHQRIGGWRMRNLLCSAVETKWTLLLDDDDLLLPNYVERVLAEDADVIYSHAEVIGDPAFNLYEQPFSGAALQQSSIVAHVALVRTELILDLGGFDPIKGYDWHFWRKAHAAGATFVNVPEKLWIYRLNPDWAHESRS